MGHQDYFLAPLPRSIALFISSPGSYSVCCNLLFIMKKDEDPKPTIVPSNTRRGIDLYTKSTLDSPSILSQLVTPPSQHHTSRVVSAGSDTMSDEFDDASTVLDESGSLGPFMDTLVAKS